MKIKLTVGEIKELNKVRDSQRGKGGFQSFMVELQWRMDDESGELQLDDIDLAKINRYARYTRGGYQNRLKRIFSRTLGHCLDELRSG